MKFQLQYEWTPIQIFFCGYSVLQLLCHNVEGTHDIKCNKKLLDWNFAYFGDLVVILLEAATEGGI